MDAIVINILVSIVASGALVSVLIWLSKEWISTRLRTSIQHEYDQKLESLKSQLKAQTDVALVELRAAIERQANLLAAAHSSFAEGQKAAMERKLRAVDTLWSRVLQLRANLPPILGFIDLLTVDEYKGIKNHPTFIELSQGWSAEKISKLIDAETEQVRPYVGEYTWAVFYSYQAVMLRIVFLLVAGRTDTEKLEWHKDSATRQLIQAVLLTTEFKEFDDTIFGKVTWLQRKLESKILSAARQIVSGTEFGAEALEQAQLIQQRAAQITTQRTAQPAAGAGR
ncbi:MAG: hypothetical protein EPO27_16080 [Betaproteobacteria bacterium]|nr:MAG: hypothetical protein EPO27_16080 [Betaproteobacteria bacterium]